MNKIATPLRLVLDTNVWLDWLVFDDPALAPLKRAQVEGAVEIFSDEACTRELVAVLNYDLGKHTLTPNRKRQSSQSFMRSLAPTPALPRCAGEGVNQRHHRCRNAATPTIRNFSSSRATAAQIIF